jgi:hypothetical protein
MAFLEVADLTAFTDITAVKAQSMIDDASAMAVLAAPCLSTELTDQQKAAVKAILRRVILRWADAGSGAVVQQQAGPFGQTVDRPSPRGLFWPSEIADLQRVCEASAGQTAFSVRPAYSATAHMPWCSLMFGATYCSCGVDIAGEPIFEGAE